MCKKNSFLSGMRTSDKKPLPVDEAMYTAFQKLGYKSYHFLEISMHNIPERHLECWHEALTNKLDGGKPIDPAHLDRLLGKYSVNFRLRQALFSQN